MKKDYTEWRVHCTNGTWKWNGGTLDTAILEYFIIYRMALRNKTIVLSIKVLDNVNGYFIIIISIIKNSKTKYTECFKRLHPITN